MHEVAIACGHQIPQQPAGTSRFGSGQVGDLGRVGVQMVEVDRELRVVDQMARAQIPARPPLPSNTSPSRALRNPSARSSYRVPAWG